MTSDLDAMFQQSCHVQTKQHDVTPYRNIMTYESNNFVIANNGTGQDMVPLPKTVLLKCNPTVQYSALQLQY